MNTLNNTIQGNAYDGLLRALTDDEHLMISILAEANRVGVLRLTPKELLWLADKLGALDDALTAYVDGASIEVETPWGNWLPVEILEE